MHRYDAVVVGAGLGGLTAAARLAQQGYRVVVLEQYTVPGGYAHEFRRGHYRFDVSLHVLDGMAPGGWAYGPLRELGALDRLSFTRLDPIWTIVRRGRELVVPADVHSYGAELSRRFPDEAAGIATLFDAIDVVFTETQGLQNDRALPYEELEKRYPRALAAMNESWADFAAEHVRSPDLRAFLDTVWHAYLGLPGSELNAAAVALPFASFHSVGAYYPLGGAAAVTSSLVDTIRAGEGEVRCRTTVARILVERGRACGVVTGRGEVLRSQIVVSNASVPDTFLRLIEPDCVAPFYASRIRRLKPSISTACVYLGLSTDVRELGFDRHHMLISENATVEEDHAAVLAGDWGATPISLTSYAEVDPTSAPDRGSVLTIASLAPWDYANVWGTGGELAGYRLRPSYLDAKRRMSEALVDRAEAWLPGLRAAVKYASAATPLTNVRYSRNPAGAVYGSEQSVGGMYHRRPGPTSPIRNLFLAGAWTSPGGGQSAAILSGWTAAALASASLD